ALSPFAFLSSILAAFPEAFMQRRQLVIGSALVALLAVLAVGQSALERAAAQTTGKVMAPRFEVDPMWPKPVGNHWLLGNTIGGNGAGVDGHILKFTKAGTFVKQFGFAYANAGSNDMWAFNRVAKISLDEANNEAYVADGYGNKRVAVIDMDTGKIKRYWGAYANKPDDARRGPYAPEPPPPRQSPNPVPSPDPPAAGPPYASDGPNARTRGFRKAGTSVKD